jgi:hypothetical protein
MKYSEIFQKNFACGNWQVKKLTGNSYHTTIKAFSVTNGHNPQAKSLAAWLFRQAGTVIFCLGRTGRKKHNKLT